MVRILNGQAIAMVLTIENRTFSSSFQMVKSKMVIIIRKLDISVWGFYWLKEEGIKLFENQTFWEPF